MRICFISDFLEGGGTEIYLQAVSKNLSKKGHRICLIVDEHLNYHKVYNKSLKGVKVYKVPYIKKPENISELIKCKQKKNNIFSLISNIILSEKIDLIHIHNLFNPFLLSEIFNLGIPVVKTLHDTRPFKPKLPRKSSDKNILEKVWGSIMIESFQKFSKIFIFSEFLKNIIITNNKELEHLIHLLPPFSPIQALIKENIKEAENTTVNNVDVLFLGRLCYEKGAYEIIKLADQNKFKNVNFLMAGLLIDSRIKMLADKRANIFLKNFLPPHEVAKILFKSRLLVFPSLANETLGFSVIDAHSFGKPVVAYDSGAVRELVKTGETGFLVPRGNIIELGAKILKLLRDSALQEEIGNNAKTFANQYYRFENHLEELLKGYWEVIS